MENAKEYSMEKIDKMEVFDFVLETVIDTVGEGNESFIVYILEALRVFDDGQY